jgi:hypothetical protein
MPQGPGVDHPEGMTGRGNEMSITACFITRLDIHTVNNSISPNRLLSDRSGALCQWFSPRIVGLVPRNTAHLHGQASRHV